MPFRTTGTVSSLRRSWCVLPWHSALSYESPRHIFVLQSANLSAGFRCKSGCHDLAKHLKTHLMPCFASSIGGRSTIRIISHQRLGWSCPVPPPPAWSTSGTCPSMRHSSPALPPTGDGLPSSAKCARALRGRQTPRGHNGKAKEVPKRAKRSFHTEA